MTMTFHLNPESGVVSRCTAKVKCRFGGESGKENHFASTAEARQGYENLRGKDTVPSSSKTKNNSQSQNGIPLEKLSAPQIESLIEESSASRGRYLRDYRRLLEYCNYEMAKDFRKTGVDPDTVKAAIRLASARAALEDHQLVASQYHQRARQADTPERKRAYQNQLEIAKKKVADDRSALKDAIVIVDQLKKDYDKKLIEHHLAVSRLQSYQQEALEGATTPTALAKPLEQLPADSKQYLEGTHEDKAHKMLASLNTRKPDEILKAAKASGNPYHEQSAAGYRLHEKKIESTSGRMIALQKQLEKATVEGKLETPESQLIVKEHSNLLSSRDHDIRVKEGYARRLELFRSEVKDSIPYYKRATEEIRETIDHAI